jgi:DNA-binding transcriptional ArsR family regulator
MPTSRATVPDAPRAGRHTDSVRRSSDGRASADASLLPELDPLIHERLRLGIVSALAVTSSLSFPELRSLLGTTDGNLSVHARRLEEAGYVRCTKSFDGRVPRTDFDLTDRGRLALEAYLGAMERLIARTRHSEDSAPRDSSLTRG